MILFTVGSLTTGKLLSGVLEEKIMKFRVEQRIQRFIEVSTFKLKANHQLTT